MTSGFQSSKFKVRLESDDGDQRVTVVVGMDGLKIMNESGTMTMRSLDLKHISRWVWTCWCTCAYEGVHAHTWLRVCWCRVAVWDEA